MGAEVTKFDPRTAAEMATDVLRDQVRTLTQERDAELAEADRLRNACHALEQENRTLREDVRGIIDRECETLTQELADVRAELANSKAEVTRLRSIIERDRTGLAAGLAEVRKIVGGYGWLARDEEWGSYEYHERTVKALRQEMADCIDQVEAAALGALQASGKRVTEAFRPETAQGG